jgi:hypothetical protein
MSRLENSGRLTTLKMMQKSGSCEKLTLFFVEFSKIEGFFWERMELQDFPLDIQEISIILTSKRRHTDLRIVESTINPSRQHPEVLSTFRDQQEWTLYSMADISQTSSLDIPQSDADEFLSVKPELSKHTKRAKLVVTSYVSRKPGLSAKNNNEPNSKPFNLLVVGVQWRT